MDIKLRLMHKNDWTSVLEIYKEGIATGNATFQQETPTYDIWTEDHLESCRLIASFNGEIIGWAALSPVSGRCVYAGVAEVSVYVSLDFSGNKVGKRLLKELILESEKDNIWTLQAGIFPENKPSIAIHEQCGFRTVGYREKVGKMNGVWRNTILLERRSTNVGIE